MGGNVRVGGDVSIGENLFGLEGSPDRFAHA
jgi:hypothetical protein